MPDHPYAFIKDKRDLVLHMREAHGSLLTVSQAPWMSLRELTNRHRLVHGLYPWGEPLEQEVAHG